MEGEAANQPTAASGQMAAFRRPRSLDYQPAAAVADVSISKGLFQVMLDSVRSRRYTAAGAALASGRFPAPLSIVALLDGAPVGWAMAHGRSWRFPFMREDDLQFGLVYVSPAHRRAGVGYRLVAELGSASASPKGDVWWLCMQANEQSGRTAERAGFEYVGVVRKPDRLRGYRLGSAPG